MTDARIAFDLSCDLNDARRAARLDGFAHAQWRAL
jgi:hypothetical protein